MYKSAWKFEIELATIIKCSKTGISNVIIKKVSEIKMKQSTIQNNLTSRDIPDVFRHDLCAEGFNRQINYIWTMVWDRFLIKDFMTYNEFRGVLSLKNIYQSHVIISYHLNLYFVLLNGCFNRIIDFLMHIILVRSDLVNNIILFLWPNWCQRTTFESSFSLRVSLLQMKCKCS